MAAKAAFGVRIPVAGVLSSPEAIRRSAIEAERLGFDGLWVHDYLIWNKELDALHISCGSREAFERAGADYPPMFYESLTSLSYCAGITSRIRLGVALLILPYREPLFTAKQVACLDDLSGGRLDLGIGQGAARSTLNVDFEVLRISRRDKVERTEDYLKAMETIWGEDEPSFVGKYVEFENATIYPKPRQKPHPFIWMGGQTQTSLDLAVNYADGWLSCWVTPEQFPLAIDRLENRQIAVTGEHRSITIGSEIHVMLGTSAKTAQSGARKTMAAFAQGYAGTIGEFTADKAASDPLAEIWASSLVGTAEEVTERLHEYVASGCTYFEMKFIYHDIEHLFDQWRQFASEVMVHFK